MKRFAIIVKVYKRVVEEQTYEIDADDLDDAIAIVRKSKNLLVHSTHIIEDEVERESSIINRDKCFEIKTPKQLNLYDKK